MARRLEWMHQREGKAMVGVTTNQSPPLQDQETERLLYLGSYVDTLASEASRTGETYTVSIDGPYFCGRVHLTVTP